MGTLLAMISITFSLGIYQAYLAVPMCLFLLLIVIKCNQEELTSLDIIKSAGRYLLVICVGLIGYFIANEIFLKILFKNICMLFRNIRSGRRKRIYGISK